MIASIADFACERRDVESVLLLAFLKEATIDRIVGAAACDSDDSMIIHAGRAHRHANRLYIKLNNFVYNLYTKTWNFVYTMQAKLCYPNNFLQDRKNHGLHAP